MLRSKIQALLYICLLALSFNTQAVIMSCADYQAANPDPTIDFDNGLVENSGCELDTELGNSNLDAADFAGFFGANWTSIGKLDFGGVDDSPLWDYSGDPISGTLTVYNEIWDAWDAIMVVLKDGTNAPGTSIGYLVLDFTDPDNIHSILSPFVNNGNLVDMSNIALFGATSPPTRGCTDPADCPREIPEPEHLFFFSLALLGGLVTKRQLKKDSRQR